MYQIQYQGGLKMKAFRKFLSLMIVLSIVVLIGTVGVGEVEASSVEADILEVESSPEDIVSTRATVYLSNFSWYANPSYTSDTFAVPNWQTGQVRGTAYSTVSSTSARIYIQKQDNNNPNQWDIYGGANNYYIIPPSGTTEVNFTFSNLEAGTYRFYVETGTSGVISRGSVHSARLTY